MKTFIQTGEKIAVTVSANINAGEGLLAGSMFGIVESTAVSGGTTVLLTEGVFDMAKAPSQAWTVGQLIYWDDTNKRATNVASGNTKIGVAVLAVGSGAGETTGRVRLNGAF